MGNFSRFFIERPIFASVIAIVITLAGLVASTVLPVAQYPEIAPPTIAISASYEVGTDVDKATFQLNSRVQLALPRLPEEVRRNGVIVQKRSNDILLVIGLVSTTGQHSTVSMADYAAVTLIDEIKRLPGIGDVLLFGSGYSMRVWLQPDRMARLGVTPTDIASAIRAQNQQYAAGRIGAEPAPPGQALTYTGIPRGRLH